MTNPSPLTRTGTLDTVETTSAPSLTRQNTEVSVSECSTPPPGTPHTTGRTVEGEDPSSKNPNSGQGKLKITACNGWEARMKLEDREREKKRVKRARSTTSLREESLEGSQVLRRPAKRGKLAELPSLPLDILFEIFGHLSPVDILHLSRTTKAFRQALLHKNATGLWKRVWENPEVEGIPERPEDLSIPAWTNLLFDAHCHNCLTSNIRTILWMLRVRLCKKCSKNLLVCETVFDKKKKLDAILMRCVPFEKHPSDDMKYCLTEEKRSFVKALESEPGDRTAFVAKKEEGIKARKAHAKRCREWAALIAEVREDELDDLRVQRKVFIRKRLEELGYEPEFEFLQMFENSDCSYRVIPPVPKFEWFDWVDEVKHAKPITQRSWNNRVKGIMVEYMERIRAIRLENDRNMFLEGRREAVALSWADWISEEPQLKRYPPGYFLPTVVDVVEHPRTQAFITEPGERIFPKEEFVAFLDNFHDAIEEWRREKGKALFGLVGDVCKRDAGLKDEESGLEWMELAMVVFSCTEYRYAKHLTAQVCDDQTLPWERSSPTNFTSFTTTDRPIDWHEDTCMFFPEYLHHVCCKASQRNHDEHTFCSSLRKMWDMETLRFNVKASAVVRRLLEACGLGLRTKARELDKVDPRLVCLKCTHGHGVDGERTVQVRTWRSSVKHAMEKHWGSNTVRFQRISGEDADRAKMLEESEWGRRTMWCMHCRDRRREAGPLTKEGLVDHIDNDHFGDLDPGDPDLPDAEGTVYTLEPWDMAHIQPLSVKMVPKMGYPLPGLS
ncbi:hypothetical protein FA13DRAFT_1731785 [Coprinellus micaceus]|uniref:F-box domain-containing protein n=1 Tax=Coprinellus micaceus TaxID=71717 RepID=A0A4Y7TEH6_COPMI|nr:hypothetical protein FA13DRAFT_1731785 [Coprinellus micaceus]